MVYLIALIVALIAACLNDRLDSTIRKSILILLCIYVILIFGFRYKVGIDTISYMDAYRYTPSLDHFFTAKTRYEPGFFFVCCLCRTFNFEFWTVQMIMATITNVCVFIFLNRYCRNVFIGIIFYFLILALYFNAEIMRESAAVGIFLINFRNLERKNWKRYYLISILSVLFHYSAIIIFFFPFVRWLKLNLVFYSLCIIFIVITPFIERMNEIIQIAAISGRIDQYVAGAQDLNFNWRLGELVHSSFPAIGVIILYRFFKIKLEFNHIILLQILFCMGAFAVPLIFSRFTNYTAMFVIVAIANLLSCGLVKNWLKIFFVAFVLLTQSYSFYNNYNRWLPYVSIFYPQDLAYRNNLYRHQFLPWLKFVRQ